MGDANTKSVDDRLTQLHIEYTETINTLTPMELLTVEMVDRVVMSTSLSINNLELYSCPVCHRFDVIVFVKASVQTWPRPYKFAPGVFFWCTLCGLLSVSSNVGGVDVIITSPIFLGEVYSGNDSYSVARRAVQQLAFADVTSIDRTAFERVMRTVVYRGFDRALRNAIDFTNNVFENVLGGAQ